ncbi:hypothetical protein QPK87_37110 [Kamptonema cortianum]|nr:hypothetical protein [Geitlerinema splendidum]MDK3162128.1 hypothetical protein [Kamptonema cortianum]
MNSPEFISKADDPEEFGRKILVSLTNNSPIGIEGTATINEEFSFTTGTELKNSFQLGAEISAVKSYYQVDYTRSTTSSYVKGQTYTIVATVPPYSRMILTARVFGSATFPLTARYGAGGFIGDATKAVTKDAHYDYEIRVVSNGGNS